MQNQTYQLSQALIDNWKIWLAHETVQQWQRVKTLPECDLKGILEIDLKIFSRISNDLKLEIQEQKSKTAIDQIESAVREIKAWLISEVGNLEEFFQQLMYRGREKLLGLGSQKINPQELLGLLAKVKSILKTHRNNLEDKIDFSLRQEYSAWEAYIKLSQKLTLSIPGNPGHKNTLPGVWNAISIHFMSKVKVEICRQYLRVLETLQQQTQSLVDAATSSAMLLAQIEQSLKKDASIKMTSIPVFTYLQQIDANKQRDLLEIWINYPMNYWGRTPIVSWQKVKEKLLSNIEPIAWDCCRDFVSVFLEHPEHSKQGQVNTNNIYQFRGLNN